MGLGGQNMCPNCFDSSYHNGECSRCGYQAKFDKHTSGRALPPGIIVKQRYCLGKVLGEGGFGITYKAYDRKKNLLCAIKEYAPNGMSVRAFDGKKIELVSPEAEAPYTAGLKRFLEESQILSKLEKIPSVVRITDSFQENATAYFVMEFLDGMDLGQRVQMARGRLPVEEATDIILQVAISMDVIHAKTRIIHRDISPDNIYITKNKKVKLIDFGSAKQVLGGAQEGFSVVVKLKISPPEQYSSSMAQGSFTDVYSLAATYYYALTGTSLPTAPERLDGKGYVPLKQLNLGVPESVSNAVDRALILNVDLRTQTMQEFIQGIAPAAKGTKIASVSSYEAEKLARQREEFQRAQARQEAARQQEIARRQEVARQQELARRQEAARQQELARRQEAAKQQELARRQEAARQQELARRQEAARQQELARRQEAARQEAAARRQEAARQEAAARRQEAARQEAAARRQEAIRQQEAAAHRQQSGPVRSATASYVSVAVGPMAGKTWTIPPNRVLKVGRSAAEADIRIEQPEDLSRVHCQISFIPERRVFCIRDLSSNGTFYNGKRLMKGKDYEVKPPARLALASTACIIEVGVKS